MVFKSDNISQEWIVKYELANDFKNGVASVKIKDGNYIYINTKGEEVEIDD